jgi:release factor glutamine methyltransferase
LPPTAPPNSPEIDRDESTVTTTWRDAMTRARGELADFGEQEARWIVEAASGLSPSELLTAFDDRVPARANDHLGVMLARRRRGEPLQYVIGSWPFRDLDLYVDERVLIPRPETEVVAQHAIACAQAFAEPTVVDLGTGSGALALAIACEVPTANVWATDASDDALAVASANLAGVGPAATRVRVSQGWWFEALPADLMGEVHVIVSNPPYVAEGELPDLPPEVREFEPRMALVAGPTGLESLSVLISGALDWLVPGGNLVCEIAPHQRGPVLDLCEAVGYAEAVVHRDLAGRDRALVARSAS